MSRSPNVVAAAVIAALTLAACGSSKPASLPAVKTGAFVSCLTAAGADPASADDATVSRYFEPVNDTLRPRAVYRLKNHLIVGIFDTPAHALAYMNGNGTVLSQRLSQQFLERNVVVDDTAKKGSHSRSQAVQNEIIACLPR